MGKITLVASNFETPDWLDNYDRKPTSKSTLLASMCKHLAVGLVSLSSVPTFRRAIRTAANGERKLIVIQTLTGACQEIIDVEVKRRGGLEAVYRSVLSGGTSYETLKASAETEQCQKSP